jgi:cytochrome c553
MNIKKIVLSVLLLFGGIMIIRSGIDAFDVTAPETAAQARANMPQNVNMIDDRIFDMPGSGNCAGCHTQSGRSAEAMASPPVIYDQYTQRI